MAMLAVNDIHVYYGSIHAVKGVSLEVNEGEIVTLIGANGAGKSTTLQTISGLLRSRTGSIELLGKPIQNVPAAKLVAHGLAQVPEGRRVFQQMTVEENLEMGAFTQANSTIAPNLERVYLEVSFYTMNRYYDKDRAGNIRTVAENPLAYMLMLKAIGTKLGLPTTFSLDNPTAAMYIMPIISSTLGAIAGEMKWMRRYMVDQMNSDYVKFARAEGLSEREIFTKHIFKNAAIPIAHGVPGVITGALSGAIIMEQVYTIPGVGGLLVQAIGAYDNAVIVGVALFYGILFIISTILGDILMAVMDPRISYTSKAR